MKYTTVALGAALSTAVLAFPGMEGNEKMMNFHKSLVRKSRTSAPLMRRDGVPDLPSLSNSSNVGAAGEIKACLSGAISCQGASPKTYVAPALGSADCDADKCCIWDYVVNDLLPIFNVASGPNTGQCTEAARQAIRLGFHDAGAWSIHSGFGGADGSMLISDEVTRSENAGLAGIVATGQALLAKYPVGAADLVQMMANVATVSCPLGPKVLSFIGRPDSPNSPDDLLPGAFSDADTLIALFADKTISSDDLVALVGAHSTSHQDFVDPTNAGSFQDSTPGVWDTLFYNETQNLDFVEADVTKFPSDIALSQDPRTAAFWTSMNDQNTWNEAYARAYVRLSLLGVANLDKLIDCTKVLPHAKNTGRPPVSVSSGVSSATSAASSSSSKAPASASSSSSPASASASASGKKSSSSVPSASGKKSDSAKASETGKPYGGGESSSAKASETGKSYGGEWPSASAKPTETSKSYEGEWSSSSAKGPKVTSTSSAKSWTDSWDDGAVTTTVTSYFTKNGWHVPASTVVCAKSELPEWAKTASWSYNPTSVTAWAIPTTKAPAPTSPPKAAITEGYCLIKTVYKTVTV